MGRIGDAVREIAIPMDKRQINSSVDKLNFQFTVRRKESIYSISRGILNRKMIEFSRVAGAQFFFEQKIWDISSWLCILVRQRENMGG
jgi:kynurenine 3-monooxygenase